MKAFFSPCHMCGSYESEVLTAAFLADGSLCKFQKIMICKKCGLVYKNPVIPELNKLVYCKGSWLDGAIFKKRISELTLFLSGFLEEISPKTIMEIGPGPGWLAMSLQELLPNSKYILLEASEEVAQVTKDNLPNATVIPSALDEACIKRDFVDLALVCGVDYLFPDFYSGIKKIYDAIAATGYLYIERNVFVETEAYAWFPIRSFRDLFGQNVLMTTWFSLEQYKHFLSLFFNVVSERSFFHDETDGYKCIIHGFLCKKKTITTEYYDGNVSWYEKNMASLGRLIKVNSTPETLAQPAAQSNLSQFTSRLFKRCSPKWGTKK